MILGVALRNSYIHLLESHMCLATAVWSPACWYSISLYYLLRYRKLPMFTLLPVTWQEPSHVCFITCYVTGNFPCLLYYLLRDRNLPTFTLLPVTWQEPSHVYFIICYVTGNFPRLLYYLLRDRKLPTFTLLPVMWQEPSHVYFIICYVTGTFPRLPHYLLRDRNLRMFTLSSKCPSLGIPFHYIIDISLSSAVQSNIRTSLLYFHL